MTPFSKILRGAAMYKQAHLLLPKNEDFFNEQKI